MLHAAFRLIVLSLFSQICGIKLLCIPPKYLVLENLYMRSFGVFSGHDFARHASTVATFIGILD